MSPPSLRRFKTDLHAAVVQVRQKDPHSLPIPFNHYSFGIGRV